VPFADLYEIMTFPLLKLRWIAGFAEFCMFVINGQHTARNFVFIKL
jgi:hypothetical protein